MMAVSVQLFSIYYISTLAHLGNSCRRKDKLIKTGIMRKNYVHSYSQINGRLYITLRIMGSQVTDDLELPESCYTESHPSIGGSPDS